MAGRHERFDVGTTLGNLGGDPEAFFASATKTNALYGELFQQPAIARNPIGVLYTALSELSGGRTVGSYVDPLPQPDPPPATLCRFRVAGSLLSFPSFWFVHVCAC